MARCANCGHEVSDTARFCTRCGSPMMKTPASLEEAPTRRLGEKDRATRQAPGGATRPAYLPPESPTSYAPMAPPSATGETPVDLGRWLSEGWQLYKRDAGTFSMAFLVMLLLSLVTLTVLTGPLLAGFYHMVFKSMRGEKPRVGDLFKGLDRFWPNAFAWLVNAVLMSVLGGGSSVRYSVGAVTVSSPLFGLISFILSPLVWAVFMFVYPLILERRRDTAAALDEAIRTVFGRSALQFWVCGFIFEILSFIGLLACGVGFFVSAPFILCAQAIAYRDTFGLIGPWSQSPSQPLWMDRD
ncbi:MAG: zinc ribbon domain-containing protein [Acidobacteria bacterium]|nr:MAG: zinc ribbon domain-containing protein [Acidobacteriota bacterium]